MRKDDLEKLTDLGLSQRGIALELGSSQGNVRHFLNKYGLKTKWKKGKKLKLCANLKCKIQLENVSSSFCSSECYYNHLWETETIPRILEGRGSAKTIRKYLLSLEAKCVWCGQGESWNGKPLSLQMDHIDGDSDNNLVSNLRLLCPNCHTQTDTYGIRNKGRSSRRKKYMDKHRK